MGSHHAFISLRTVGGVSRVHIEKDIAMGTEHEESRGMKLNLRCSFGDYATLTCHLDEVDLRGVKLARKNVIAGAYFAIIAVSDAADQELKLLLGRSWRHVES